MLLPPGGKSSDRIVSNICAFINTDLNCCKYNDRTPVGVDTQALRTHFVPLQIVFRIIVWLSSTWIPMIFQVCLLLVLFFCAFSALQISSTSPYYKEGEQEGNRSAEAYSLLLTEFSNSTDVFTSGFVRTDIYDSRNQWIRAQVMPIGVCFKEGDRGGTAVTLQVTMTSSHILRVTNIYAGSDCNGGYTSVLLKSPIVKTVGGYKHNIKYSADIKIALSIHEHFTDGIVVS